MGENRGFNVKTTTTIPYKFLIHHRSNLYNLLYLSIIIIRNMRRSIILTSTHFSLLSGSSVQTFFVYPMILCGLEWAPVREN